MNQATFFQRLQRVLVVAFLLCAFQSCFDSDDINQGAYYTFVGETVYSYLLDYPEYFSEFVEILDTTGIGNLLSTYGTYTCFVPTNEALHAYYEDSSKTSWRDFDLETLKDMVYYQIIDAKTISSTEFPQGRIDETNMKSRFVEISFSSLVNSGYITVNGSAKILIKDQAVHNGIVHVLDEVLVPSNYLLPECIKENKQYSLFSEALYMTGLSDSLVKIIDDGYTQPINYVDQNGQTVETPSQRLYGYTALVETDSIYHLHQIYTIDDLIVYAAKVYDSMYPEDAAISDYTNRQNSLNRFVAYHLFDYMCYYNEFIYTEALLPDRQPVEYIQTMCPYTLLEVRAGNIFNTQKSGKHISMIDGTSNQYYTSCLNGVCYAIDDILVYDEGVMNDVLGKRLRFDVYSTLPEMMNINARNNKRLYYPSGFFENLSYRDDASKVLGQIPQNGSVQYQGCMFYIYGWYDVTHILPPVPEGSWEFRIGIKTRANSIVQIYVDNIPNGIPLDMSKEADHPDIGYIPDIETEDEGASNDKDLRNRGWMKAPDYFMQYPSGKSGRESTHSLRRILGTYPFEYGKDHSLRMKAVSSSGSGDYFGYDYIEFIPKALIETEDKQ